jgi:MFS family permease
MSPSSHQGIRLLTTGPFSRYMAGETISMLGTWMQQMAQGWVLAGLTTDASTLGMVNFLSGIPMLALTMFGGVVADRHDKRLILGLVMIVQAALAIAIGALVASQSIAIWHIACAGVCLGISTAFEVPAAAALVPELVAKDQIRSAIALDRSIFHATRLLGPALGGALISALGTASAFFANAASFAALLVALCTIRPRPRGTDAEEQRRQTGMKDGIRYVAADRPTRTMLTLLAMATLFVSPFFMILMPLYSRHVLGIDAGQHGLLMGASGAGAFLGSLRLMAIAPGQRSVYLRISAGLVTLAMIALGSAHGLLLALPSLVLMTFGTSTLFGLANTIVQERAPDSLRGRVSALAGLSFFGVLPFAGLITSHLADWIGMRSAMIAGALGFGLCATLLLGAKGCAAISQVNNSGNAHPRSDE